MLSTPFSVIPPSLAYQIFRAPKVGSADFDLLSACSFFKIGPQHQKNSANPDLGQILVFLTT